MKFMKKNDMLDEATLLKDGCKKLVWLEQCDVFFDKAVSQSSNKHVAC
jgi:hypothetical protein